MFTAKDLHNKLKSLEECHGLDEWIEDVLYKEFIRFEIYAIISTTTIGRNGWNKNGFTSEMRKRGFSLDYKSDQRDGDYYIITFPPQER